jgi:hypothetical protein
VDGLVISAGAETEYSPTSSGVGKKRRVASIWASTSSIVGTGILTPQSGQITVFPACFERG